MFFSFLEVSIVPFHVLTNLCGMDSFLIYIGFRFVILTCNFD